MSAFSHSSLPARSEYLEGEGARGTRSLRVHWSGPRLHLPAQIRLAHVRPRRGLRKGHSSGGCFRNASRILCQNIHWNSSAVESITRKRHLRAAAVGRRTGRRYRASGQRRQECACSTHGMRRLAPRSNSGRAHAAGDNGRNSKTLNGLRWLATRS